MNIDINYSESTTSSHYSANTIAYAGYPIAIRYRDATTHKTAKGAILFISEDLKHDHEQLKEGHWKSVKRTVAKASRTGTGGVITALGSLNPVILLENWSKLTKMFLEERIQSCALCKVSWEFWESNEAKNEWHSVQSVKLP